MTNLHSFWIVVICVAVTMLTRFLPFLLLGNDKKMPLFIHRLAKALPCTMMGMLVVYCLKDATWLSAPYGLGELLSCAAVVLLHVWKRNTLLSIASGTACYMIFLQLLG